MLIALRLLVHQGHRLISHPLNASIRMMYSPVRSVIVSSDCSTMDEHSLQIIEQSIDTYQRTIGKRQMDIRNQSDYELLDRMLLNAAIKEFSTVSDNRIY